MVMTGQDHFDRADLDFEDSAFADAFHGHELDFNLIGDLDDGGNDFATGFFHGQTSDFDFGASAHNSRAFGNTSKACLSLSSLHAAPDPPSMQHSIISSRSGQVDLHFGQITPPDEMVPQPFNAPPEKQAQVQKHDLNTRKLSNEQRARNAANTRHARPKVATKDSAVALNGESRLKQSGNINLQREKNRVAAAKCRAKKKSANEQQEEMANEFGNTHSHLTKEIRELKNAKAELQNYLLAHRPGVCECHGIHDYNLGQAHKLVLNARRQAAEPSIHSPSLDSVFSGQSSGSDRTGTMFPAPSPTVSPLAMDMQSPAQSFNRPLDVDFDPMTSAEPVHSEMCDGQGVPHGFTNFFQSSPGDRAGFP